MGNNSMYIRTEKAIMTTFVEILKEKPFERITIQDILDRTPVSRGTFYSHFHDKYEIAERLAADFLQDRREYRANQKKRGKSGIIKSHYFRTIPENRQELYRILLSIRTENIDLPKSIVQEYVEEYMNEMDHHGPDALIEARLYGHMRMELEFIAALTEDRLTYEQLSTILRNVSVNIANRMKNC